MSEHLNKLIEITDKLPPVLTSLVSASGKDFVEYKGDNGVNSIGFGLYKGNRIAVQRSYMPMGFSLPIHQHEEKEWLIVFSGKLHIKYDGKEVTMMPGDSIYFECRQPHYVTALDNTWVLGVTIPPAPGYPES